MNLYPSELRLYRKLINTLNELQIAENVLVEAPNESTLVFEDLAKDRVAIVCHEGSWVMQIPTRNPQ